MGLSEIKYMELTLPVTCTSRNTQASEAEQALIESVSTKISVQDKTRVTKQDCPVWKRAFREHNVSPNNKHAYMSQLLDYQRVLYFCKRTANLPQQNS